MTYNKPTIEVLGDAVSVIQGGKQGPVNDFGQQAVNPPAPAYELDE